MRKEWKKAAKNSLKKHYWILVVLCLFASFLGIEYGMSFAAVHAQMPQTNIEEVFTDMLVDEDVAKEEVTASQEDIESHDTNAYLGRSRGVLSMVLNSYSSGSFVVAAGDAVRNMVGSGNVYIVLMILGGLAVYCFVWLFIKETYLIIMRRIVLECRTYNKVMMQRFLYPIQTKQWPRMAWVMFVKSMYQYLWSLTVIGGIIKKYSYSMVPYIMAENPTLGANEAITLSRKMMNGHKWEYFVADLSFIGWGLLNIVTLGLSGIFYSNPYKAAFFGEFYAYVRKQAKDGQIPGAQALSDTFLFEKPDRETVAAAYPDLVEFVGSQAGDKVSAPKGFFGMLSRVFGIVLVQSDEILAYERQRADSQKLKQSQEILTGEVYPSRMAPAPTAHKVTSTSNLLPTKSYTVVHLIMMFFIFSMIGWIWEVSLHLISDGEFVNRGVLHGPWLPIYGTGGILILIVLKRLREKPAFEFIAAVILCGCVEYYTAWHLEMTHNGQKWWDYSGYFLNLDGRICAEGLLVFGLGGLAIVYLLAPFLDNLLHKVNAKVLAVIAAVLLVVYVGDQMYSSKHPNEGKGITTASIERTVEYDTELRM